ncbi:MAG TPA: molybdenum ABC transporter ATP-binding protein [Polyangiaceae bacterium]|nr:molybdenum ABC transporter ATP-binding protein [Polyangiaceae bacterium]
MSSLEIVVRGRRGFFELDVELELPAKGVTAIFGRSGCGKTSLLRAVAGLERMQGRVSVGGKCWQAGEQFLPPDQRSVGYVFQEAALLPHLSVRGNLEYASRRCPAPRIDQPRVVEWLALHELLERRPAELSGGERQRVAVARALLRSPELLLMDEPLAALDLQARAAILGHLEKLFDEISVPVLYVTHATDEVARLADRVVWLDAGRVRSVATPEVLFAELEVGAWLGDDAATFVSARVLRHDDGYHLSELETSWGILFVPRLAAAVGASVRLRLRARDISIALGREQKTSILNVFAARVAESLPVGPGEVLVQLACPSDPTQQVLARVTRKSAEEMGLGRGLQVWAQVKGVSVR